VTLGGPGRSLWWRTRRDSGNAPKGPFSTLSVTKGSFSA
jgi:hypothetical protein